MKLPQVENGASAFSSPYRCFLWPSSRRKQPGRTTPYRAQSGERLLDPWIVCTIGDITVKEERIVIHETNCLTVYECLTQQCSPRSRNACVKCSRPTRHLPRHSSHTMYRSPPTTLRPPVAGVSRALAHAVTLIASAWRVFNPSNIPTRARLRHQLIAREDTEAKPTAFLLGMRVPVEMLAERSAVYLPVVLVRRGPADEDRRCAVLVVLARLAAGRGVFVRALVFDAAGAGAVVGDAIEGSAAPDRKSTRLNSSHSGESRMPSSA